LKWVELAVLGVKFPAAVWSLPNPEKKKAGLIITFYFEHLAYYQNSNKTSNYNDPISITIMGSLAN